MGHIYTYIAKMSWTIKENWIKTCFDPHFKIADSEFFFGDVDNGHIPRKNIVSDKNVI